MSESIEMKNAEELVAREHIRATNTGSTLVIDDGTNVATIPGLPYGFEAADDKVLVAVDIFKSGFECKECKGVGRLKEECDCFDTKRPGFKYGFAIEGTPQWNIVCPECTGDPSSKHVDIACPSCKGKGHIIFVPDSAKSMPTTGVVVSIGADVTNKKITHGCRVLYGAYSGTMVPTKEPGVSFKFLRQHEILGYITGGEALGAFDFVIPEEVR